MTQATALPKSVSPVAPSEPRAGPIIAFVSDAEPCRALHAAFLLASAGHAEVLAVSILTNLASHPVGEEDSAALTSGREVQERAALATRLTERVRECALADVPWRTRVLGGVPAPALAELARTLHSPLIVMGIGSANANRIVSVETILRTIQDASCAVLAVHPDMNGLFHEVVLATDFGPSSARAGEVVVPFLSENATLHLVHVVEPTAAGPNGANAFDDARADSLAGRFRRFIDELSTPRGVSVHSAIGEGHAAEQLLDFAARHHADLIVTGRHGSGAIKQFFIGSVTKTVMRGAKCSVLVTPTPGSADADRLRLTLSGTSESDDPTHWEAQLAGLTDRNRGRHTILKIEDVAEQEWSNPASCCSAPGTTRPRGVSSSRLSTVQTPRDP